MSAKPSYQTDAHTEFKVYLLRRSLSQRAIARQLGITVQYLNDVILSKRKGRKIRTRLVREIGIPADLVAYRPEECEAA